MGVRPGDRVGIHLRKSIDSVAAIYGVLKAGAAYVPVDPLAPAARNAYIMHDCAVAALVIEARFDERFRNEHEALGALPAAIVVDQAGNGAGLRDALDGLDAQAPARARSNGGIRTRRPRLHPLHVGLDRKPKGVMLSHENATSFVDWCSESFAPQPEDRFSSHAPFHFDLSILDLYVCLKHGATLVLIGEGLGKDPERLAALIADERISVWYSAPSILSAARAIRPARRTTTARRFGSCSSPAKSFR